MKKKKIEKRRVMTWMLMWLNVSVATLNAMLYLLVLYRLPRYTHPSLTNMPPYTLAFVA